MRGFAASELRAVTTLLCDADGTLFPSEEPAYAASAVVTRSFAERYGLDGDFSAAQLRRIGTGRSFRSLSADLLRGAGIEPTPDEHATWIARERDAVTEHLRHTLRPDVEVVSVTRRLHARYRLAVVSASATVRVLASLRATGLNSTFAAPQIFSAEDSMPAPVPKPDPAIYRFALGALNIAASQAVAVEDSSTGVRAAVAAGIATIGTVGYVPTDEREERIQSLLDAGARSVVSGWLEIESVLT